MKRQIQEENGELILGGVGVKTLAAQYGTPLYVMDENVIRSNMRAFKSSMDKYYGGKGLVCYASKAFSCKEIYRIAKEEGIGADVVSIGEMYTAKSIGFPMDQVCFHGNNKTRRELEAALDWGVTRIVVDNLTELHTLSALAKEKASSPRSCCGSSPASTPTRMISSAPGRLTPNSVWLWRRGRPWRV